MSSKERKKILVKLEEYRDNLLRELDSLDHVIQCSLNNYDYMIDFAIKKGFKRVVDIGCAYGHQSELCRDRIEYVGINQGLVRFYNINENNSYYANKYPFYTSGIFQNDLAISNLAIGWKCYVNEEEFRLQCKALSKDFKACLLYIPTDRYEILKEYFKNIEIYKKKRESNLLSTAFYYCYN